MTVKIKKKTIFLKLKKKLYLIIYNNLIIYKKRLKISLNEFVYSVITNIIIW